MTPAADGTLYICTADGWTEIGRTEGGIQWLRDRDPDVPEYPFAGLSSWSVTVAVPLTRAGLRCVHVTHGGQKSPHRCCFCNPKGNPPKLRIDGHEYHRRQQARKKRRR